MIIFGHNSAIIAETRTLLGKRMEFTDLGIAKFFLGIEIYRDRSIRIIALTQRGYTTKILEKFVKGLFNKSNPCAQGNRLEPNSRKASIEDIQLFQQQIRSLMYLITATRPDLAFPIGQLARYMANPDKNHFKALQQIWCYIQGTRDLGLTYKSDSITPLLRGYVDSD